MKRIIITLILVIAVMLSACSTTETVEEVVTTEQPVTIEYEQYVDEEVEETIYEELEKLKTIEGETVFYNIVLTSEGPEPATIKANVGDTLILEIVNMYDGYDMQGGYDNDLNELDDYADADNDVYDRHVRFLIEEFNVDEWIDMGQAVDVTVELNMPGTFDYGDDSTLTVKGRLIVE